MNIERIKRDFIFDSFEDALFIRKYLKKLDKIDL